MKKMKKMKNDLVLKILAFVIAIVLWTYVMDEVNFNDYDMVILPGGMPGASNLAEDARVIETVQAFMKEGKYVAAICADRKSVV